MCGSLHANQLLNAAGYFELCLQVSLVCADLGPCHCLHTLSDPLDVDKLDCGDIVHYICLHVMGRDVGGCTCEESDVGGVCM